MVRGYMGESTPTAVEPLVLEWRESEGGLGPGAWGGPSVRSFDSWVGTCPS